MPRLIGKRIILREYQREDFDFEGKYTDTIHMGILKREWQDIHYI